MISRRHLGADAYSEDFVTVRCTVGEPRVSCGLSFLMMPIASMARQCGFMACSCHPRKSEEAAQAASLQNRCQ